MKHTSHVHGFAHSAPRAFARHVLLALVLLTMLLGPASPVLAVEDPPEYLYGWGTGGTGAGEFNEPRGVALDDEGNVYVVDAANDRVQKFDAYGAFIAEFGSSGSGADQFILPFDVVVDSYGDVWVSDYHNHCVKKFHDSGGNTYGCVDTIGTPGTPGTADEVFWYPWGLAVDGDDNLYVADNWNNRIQKFTSSGTFVTKWGIADSNDNSEGGRFENPTEVAVDSSGNVYVADNNNYRIQKFVWNPALGDSGEYQFVTKWTVSNGGLYGLALDSQGNVYVTDNANDLIRKYDGTGTVLSMWGNSGSCDSCLDQPFGIAVNDDGDVYVADLGNNRIQVFNYLVDVELDLETGWNMVSVPVVPADASRAAVFPPADVVAVYTWNPVTKSYEVPTDIAPEVGYWVAVTEPKTITVSGEPVTEWESGLTAGWNMIGSVCGNAVSVNDADVFTVAPPGSVLTNAIYWWNPISKSYETATSIVESQGYWAATTVDCILTMTAPV